MTTSPALILRMGAGFRTLEVPGAGEVIDLMPLFNRLPEIRPRTNGEARRQADAMHAAELDLFNVINHAKAGLSKLGWFRHQRPAAKRSKQQ